MLSMASQKDVNMIAEYVKANQRRSGGHDWWHVYRVWQVSKFLAKKEGADLIVVQLAALLHDLADWKFHSEKEQVEVPEGVMKRFNIDTDTRRHVLAIIANLSFKGANEKNKIKTIEGMCAQDADRLDAIGAMGIARCFEFGGSRGKLMHDPTRKTRVKISKKEYMNTTTSGNTSIDHFYQKLILLKDRMNTKTARRIAERRHKFMEDYLREFHKEWDMKDIVMK